jgi:NADPH:quinone reductase-like Zn-dependent oxidoreductase
VTAARSGTLKPREKGVSAMPKAVRFKEYGGIDVLEVVDVERPVPGTGQVLVEVRAAAVNPGEASIREGLLAQRWPATFPSGEGSDLAGVVAELGPDVPGFAVGDEVIGYTDNRASHAEYVLVEREHLTHRPAGVPWPVAGSLYVAGTTAVAAVRAVAAGTGDTVVVSGAAGGVGSIAVQLATLAGATVIGLASEPHHGWLSGHGVIPVGYGAGVADRIRAASGGRVDAFIDTFGQGYVDLALELDVRPERVNTIIDFAAAQRHGVKTEGNMVGVGGEVLAELAGLVDKGAIEVPIAREYPLAEVREAYREVERRHTLGKIVLRPTG